jgi:catechol 2,3-dioxygenase-like lactoylglutathione lyase family enzyme
VVGYKPCNGGISDLFRLLPVGLSGETERLSLPVSLNHITLIVSDVDRTARMLRYIFDAEEVYDSRGKNYSLSYEKFLSIGGTWIAVMEGSPRAGRSYDHVAFGVPDSEFEKTVSRVKQMGLEIKPGRDRAAGEGRSIYFYDFDNHLFELHTGTLEDRLAAYAGAENGL